MMSRGAKAQLLGSGLVIVVVVVVEVSDLNTCHHGAKLFGWFEDWHGTRGDLNGRPRTRVARHARFALANLERPEPADFDVLLFLQGVFYRVKERVDNPCTVLLGDRRARRLRNSRRDVLDQIGFRHGLYQGFDARRQGLRRSVPKVRTYDVSAYQSSGWATSSTT